MLCVLLKRSGVDAGCLSQCTCRHLFLIYNTCSVHIHNIILYLYLHLPIHIHVHKWVNRYMYMCTCTSLVAPTCSTHVLRCPILMYEGVHNILSCVCVCVFELRVCAYTPFTILFYSYMTLQTCFTMQWNSLNSPWQLCRKLSLK